MIVLAAGAAVGALIGWFLIDRADGYDFAGTWGGGFVGLIAMILFSFIGPAPMAPRTPFHGTVVSGHDGSGTQGEFALGSGYIGTELYYDVYYKTGDNSYMRFQAPSSKTTVIEDAETPADATIDIAYSPHATLSNWVLFSYTPLEYTHIEVHVPKGTVVHTITAGG